MMDNSTLCNDAVVKEIAGNEVLVEMTIKSACDGCHAKSVCISSQRRNELVKIDNTAHTPLKIGDSVKIGIKQSIGNQAIFIAYGLPFVVLFVFFILISVVFGNELVAALIALVATGLYFALLALFNKKKK
ncbi:MAG: SoxR reducing system RseC family protein [Bacteroidales bacterium]|jgi:sigma-E factor negative regulatory protein RseC|nr:SoxR reducing system RseC family protein [Bacteroidales bacterium]